MIKQKYPEPTVGGLVFNEKGEIILIKSHKWHNKFVLPGGHIEVGEKMESALKREMKEETGLDVFDLQFFNMQEFIYDKAYWKKKHFIFLEFIAKTKSSKVQLNEEAQDYVWIRPKEALKMPLEPYTKRAVEAYIKRYLKNR